MALRDLGELLADDALTIPVPGGQHVRIPSPSAEVGLRIQLVLELGMKAASGSALTDRDRERVELDDDGERDLMRDVLGAAFDELTAVMSWVQLQRTFRYALLWFGIGPEAADEALASGRLSGEAAAPTRAERRASRSGRGQSSPAQVSAGGSSSRKPKGKGKA